MKKLLLALAVLSATSAFAAGPKVPYTHEGFYSTDKVQKAVHFVSVEDIKKSLEGKGPINVSFDITSFKWIFHLWTALLPNSWR